VSNVVKLIQPGMFNDLLTDSIALAAAYR